MANRLASESSPYLLQHAKNPVNWYPWGEEALTRAVNEEKPIFLSIGYSACHWCHVMERESFEDPEIAKQLNENFICIKVDREERPDLDHLYMGAVQAISGRGGWPMSVFLTQYQEPFFGGTYWPPRTQMGLPGFDEILRAVSDAWKNRRGSVTQQSRELTDHLRKAGQAATSPGEIDVELLREAAAHLERSFDFQEGGFGGAPKFPHPMDLRLLLRYWRRVGKPGPLQMVTLTLDKMAAGGIRDHLGGGFHRYTVDGRWLVPHFEKMVYDNALLGTVYAEAYQATRKQEYAEVVRETMDYVLREMTDSKGGFYSAQDADSEGEEGKFYVWTTAEVEKILGPDAAKAFCYVYDITPLGNFEGKNILNLPKTIRQSAEVLGRDGEELRAELQESRKKLLAVRSRRVAPFLDDKVLVSWNGLMIEALALAGAVLNEPRYVEAAARGAEFLLKKLRNKEGGLFHYWRKGYTRMNAFLDDYTCLANGLITLYEADFREKWLDEAARLMEFVLAEFPDSQEGGFFFTPAKHERLIARQKDSHDGSVPSGNAMAVTALLRLGKLSGSKRYLLAAEKTLRGFGGLMRTSSMATSQMLLAAEFYLGPTQEVVLMGDRKLPATVQAIEQLRGRFWPNKVIAARPTKDISSILNPLFTGKSAPEKGAGPIAYICQDFMCRAPISGNEEIGKAFDQIAPRPEGV